MNENILILGATSAIAQAVARRYAEHGANLHLVARNAERTSEVTNDLTARGANKVTTHTANAADDSSQTEILQAAFEALPRVDLVLLAWGNLPDEAECEADTGALQDQFKVNGLSPVLLLNRLAPMLAEQPGDSHIAVISSVAGDRGRKSNYAYGAAKAALTTFADGLGGRYLPKGVKVTVVKPGFVATPMTAGLDLPGPLVATPEKVAQRLIKATEKGKPTVHTPAFWRGIMLIIKAIPTTVMRRLPI